MSTDSKLLLQKILVARSEERVPLSHISATLHDTMQPASYGLRRQPPGEPERSYSLLDLTSLETTVRPQREREDTEYRGLKREGGSAQRQRDRPWIPDASSSAV